MERLDPPLIAEALLSAPGWARVGLTSPKPDLRENAARELADSIARALSAPQPISQDEGQQTLAL